jgi:hypothetical protein
MNSKSFTLLALAILFFAGSGCARLDLRKNIPWGDSLLGGSDPAAKVVCMWTDTVMQQTGQEAKRGFGGLLLFYSREDGKPVKTKGTLVIYAFDEANRHPANPTPDRKYVFTPDQFPKHYSKTGAGHSYSFWIPWDVAGGEQKEISLIARFTPSEDGGVVVSEQARVLLPGTTLPIPASPISSPAPTAETAPRKTEGVQQASFMEPAENTPQAAPRSLATTTINLPSHFGRRVPPLGGGVRPLESLKAQQANAMAQPAIDELQRQQIQQAVNSTLQNSQNPASNSMLPSPNPGTQPATNPAPPPTLGTGLSPNPRRQSLSRFGLERSRVLGAPLVAPGRGHFQKPPSPSGSQFALAPQPQAETPPQSGSNVAGFR